MIKYALAILILSSCAQTGTLNVETSPEGGIVSVKDTRGNILRKGTAPTKIDLAGLTSEDFLFVDISKRGFLTRTIVVPKSFLAKDHRLNISLISLSGNSTPLEEAEGESCQTVSKESFEDLAKGVAATQASLTRKDFTSARRQITDLINKYPFVSVLYDLQGNIFYLQKDFNSALRSYERSLILNKDNPETAIIIQKLRSITGKGSLGGQP